MATVLVTGAGGFIGHHLVKHLVEEGYRVRGVDIKAPEFEHTAADEFILAALQEYGHCLTATQGIDEVYHLAADMGSIGYISSFHAEISINNTLINAHMLQAARKNQVQRFLFSSSACIHPQHLQRTADVVPLREEDAFPADPEEGYGLEKLYMEKLCQYFTEDGSLQRASYVFTMSRTSWHLRRRSGESAGGDLPKGRGNPEQRQDPDLG